MFGPMSRCVGLRGVCRRESGVAFVGFVVFGGVDSREHHEQQTAATPVPSVLVLAMWFNKASPTAS